MEGGAQTVGGVVDDVQESLQERRSVGGEKAPGDGDGVLVAKEVDGEVVIVNVAEEEKKGDEKGSKDVLSERGSVSIFRLFGFADPYDYFLMFVGFVGAAAHGCALPVFFVFFGKLLNGFGANVNNPDKAASVVGRVRQSMTASISILGFQDFFCNFLQLVLFRGLPSL